MQALEGSELQSVVMNFHGVGSVGGGKGGNKLQSLA